MIYSGVLLLIILTTSSVGTSYSIYRPLTDDPAPRSASADPSAQSTADGSSSSPYVIGMVGGLSSPDSDEANRGAFTTQMVFWRAFMRTVQQNLNTFFEQMITASKRAVTSATRKEGVGGTSVNGVAPGSTADVVETADHELNPWIANKDGGSEVSSSSSGSNSGGSSAATALGASTIGVGEGDFPRPPKGGKPTGLEPPRVESPDADSIAKVPNSLASQSGAAVGQQQSSSSSSSAGSSSSTAAESSNRSSSPFDPFGIGALFG